VKVCERLSIEAAEDVVQEALVAAFVHRAEVDRPEPWLVRVVDRRCCDWHRRRAVAERTRDELAAGAAATSPTPSGERLDLSRALARLPRKMRTVVRLRYVEGLRSDEAADKLGYTPASYRSTLGRTLSSLRALLGADEHDTPSTI
jgi:RNA polymerase sigma factor (sigma-70 family)